MAENTVKDRVQTGVLVTIVTFLVWLYAEGENVKTYENVPVTIEFVGARENLVIDQPEREVQVNFRCSRGVYDRLRDLSQGDPIRLELNAESKNPIQTVILSERLSELAEFNNLGVEIRDTQPRTLDVRVERLEPKLIAVDVIPGDIQLQGPPIVNPLKVNVTMPSSLIESIEDVRLEARLSEITDLASLRPNEPYERAVTLTLPDAFRRPDVTVDPQVVMVRFTIRKLEREFTIPRVRIVVELPLDRQGQYIVEQPDGQDVVRDMTLVGPNDLIEKIEMNELEITAVLKLNSEELDTNITSKLLHINKPEQVRVTSELPLLNFKLKKKAE